MNELVSPKYQMKLVSEVESAIWKEYTSYKLVKIYIEKWHENNENYYSYENFSISMKDDDKIDLTTTLHNIPGDILLKIAIDLGIDTPDFIPSIPTFKNEIKSDYSNAYKTFLKAHSLIENDPSTAIGFANSALESIIKEILKDERIKQKTTGKETLYKLTIIILKEFKLSTLDHPKEIKTICTSLTSINQSIEKLRSEKTIMHGKTDDDKIIEDPIYSSLVVNSVSTVGLFLLKFYKSKYQPQKQIEANDLEDLPF